jgi:GTP1/Obg family GTP-binding protein
MAYNRTNYGIEDWANQGFESKIVQEVKKALAEQAAEHRSQMRDLENQMRKLGNHINHINGFYTWLMEVYPDTYVQYKSLMDLQKASEEPNRLKRELGI